MGIVNQHIQKEVKIARRFVAIHGVKVPFDLEELVREYADLQFRHIPITGVDGVTVHLKVPGKRPTIIVNDAQPSTRKRFTLAHELGHVIIPWHTGTIVDEIYSPGTLQMQYWFIEQEANLFAAEILMPLDFVTEKYQTLDGDLRKVHKAITSEAHVSDIACAIRMTQLLPPEIVFLEVNEEGVVVNNGKTSHSTVIPPFKGSEYSPDFFKIVKNSYVVRSGSHTFYWYDLNADAKVDFDDDRSWREILDNIATDIKPPNEREAFKRSVNGIVSNAHSTVKGRNPNYSVEFMVTAISNRLNRNEFKPMIEHPDFSVFAYKRAYDFYHGIKKR